MINLLSKPKTRVVFPTSAEDRLFTLSAFLALTLTVLFPGIMEQRGSAFAHREIRQKRYSD